MAITKEALLKLADSSTQQVPFGQNGDFVIIRRLKLSERNALLNEKRESGDLQAGLALTRAIVAKAMVDPPVTVEEVEELPAALVDLISKAVMEFNGWTKEGQAAIADHFRPAS